MQKLKMHTPDLTQDNIARIGELFPSCVTEVKDAQGNIMLAIDFDQLKQELSNQVVEGPQERYHLNWPGKREALLTANAPIAKTLRPVRDESVDFDTTKNLFIEGDNLEALKLLQEIYLGKVKMIYIDPPYNTGNDFVYDDDFAQDYDEFLIKTNQKDEVGNRLVANPESNGRFHSDWLTMIYPRIRLARNLLSEDGFIITSIDDAEAANLKKILDEILGEDNHIAVLCWDRNRKNDAKFFSVGHEYMFIYAKNKQSLVENNIILREPKEGLDAAHVLFEKLKAKHGTNWEIIENEWRQYFRSIPDADPRKKLGRYSKVGPDGPYRDDGNISWPGGGGPKYEVLHPVTKKPCKVPEGGWRYSKPERFWEEVQSGKVVFGPDEKTLPRQCRRLFDGDGQVMPSVFYSYAQTAAVEFIDLMGGRVFENPKNWRDLQRITRYLTKRDDVILDFFAGSASTAHAVLAQNAEDGGKRRYILAQIPENVDESSEAYKAGYKNIAEISKDRIKKATKKILEENPESSRSLDIGFRVLKIDSSNMADIYYVPDAVKQTDLLKAVENIKPDRNNPEDLLFQVLLDWGVDLTLPIRKEKIQGKQIFFVDENALVACFDTGIPEELVKELAGRKPLRVVFRDNGFASDAVKINVDQIFKQLSPGTDVKSI